MKHLKNKKGQTTVEYIFMLVVAATLVLAFAERLKTWLVGNQPCPNNSVTCKILAVYSGKCFFDVDSRFRYFSIRS
jgi:hypothetical protein